jgi:hypothetical protein
MMVIIITLAAPPTPPVPRQSLFAMHTLLVSVPKLKAYGSVSHLKLLVTFLIFGTATTFCLVTRLEPIQ